MEKKTMALTGGGVLSTVGLGLALMKGCASEEAPVAPPPPTENESAAIQLDAFREECRAGLSEVRESINPIPSWVPIIGAAEPEPERREVQAQIDQCAAYKQHQAEGAKAREETAKAASEKPDPTKRITKDFAGTQHFEGYETSTGLQGTVTYPGGETITGTFHPADATNTMPYGTNSYKSTGTLLPAGPAQWVSPRGTRLDFTVDYLTETEELAKFTDEGGKVAMLTSMPDKEDAQWNGPAYTTEEGFPANMEYSLNFTTGKLGIAPGAYSPEGTPTRDPSTVRSLEESEISTYTGYAKCTKFPEESPYKGYEGEWQEGKFSGYGTLRLKNGQTVEGFFRQGTPEPNTHPIKFSPKSGEPLLDLIELPEGYGWMRWKDPSKKAGDWEKYVWDETANAMIKYDMKAD